MTIWAECMFKVRGGPLSGTPAGLSYLPQERAGWLEAQLKALPGNPGEPQKQHHQLRCSRLSLLPQLASQPKSTKEEVQEMERKRPADHDLSQVCFQGYKMNTKLGCRIESLNLPSLSF